MELEFKYPFLLLLLIPAAIAIYVFYKQVKTMIKREKMVLICMRSVVFTLLIVSLATPYLKFITDEQNVVFITDTSASMRGTEKEILSWIEKSIKSKRQKDEFAIVSVAKNAAVEQALNANDETIAQFSPNAYQYDTNLEAGIQLATSLFPNNNGRIVLFSDGNETTGTIRETAHLLKQQGIILDYVKVAGNIGQDMAMTEFTVSPSLYEGETASIKMTITSNYEQTAKIRIMLNNKEVLNDEVNVKEGNNAFSFTHKVSDTGLFNYKGEISASGDTFAENNYLHAISNVKGTPKVLIVQNNEEENLISALQSSGLIVNQSIPEQLPTTLDGYLRYQSIVFNNISATDVGEDKMKLIEHAVKDFGTGFIMTGGENSFGLGGYFKTPIEDILPVEMEVKGKQELPSLGLMIVLDRSGSMEGQKLSLAKEAAARSVDLLRDKDTLGFIAFDDKPLEIIETAPLNDKEEAIDKIRSVSSGGGTDIFPALEMAFQKLMPLKLGRKHIILLTDGQSVTNQDYYKLIDEGKKTNITLSTVALGQDADKRLLEDLAEYGTGRFYDVVDDSVIPSILSRETAMVTRTYIVDHPFYPNIHAGNDWKDLFTEGVPQMNAYIATTPKAKATMVLSSEKKDPVLAEWQYGLGKTIAYTSDTSGKWAGDWNRWGKWPLFLNELISRTLPSYSSEPYSINVDTEDGRTIIHLISSTPDLTPIETAIVSDKGEEMDASMKVSAPGKYELLMEQEPGMYFLRIKQRTENEEERLYTTGFTVPYSDELLLKGQNISLLEEVANITGGKELSSEKHAFSSVSQVNIKKQPISSWIILTAFFLFFIEIAIRRFGLASLLRVFPKKKISSYGQNKTPIQQKLRATAKMAEGERNTDQNVERPKKVKNKHNNSKLTLHEEHKDAQVNQEERMQRLLDAKNRKNR